MDSTATKGNDPKRWDKLLIELDEKLQLGLLEHMRRVSSYHFEGDVLYVEPGSEEDKEYLKRDATFQQLVFLAQEAVGIEKVKLGKP